MSSKPFTEAQVSILDRTCIFGVMPLYSPEGEYITPVKEACLKVHQKQQRNSGLKPVECFSVSAT